MAIEDGQLRQQRIDRGEQDPATQRLIAPRDAAPSAGGAFVLGKVVEVNRDKMDAHLAPIKEGVDARDENVWADDANFSGPPYLCCWTAGLSLISIGNPAVAFTATDGSRWIMPWLNFVGRDTAALCGPQGPLSPAAPRDCPPEPDPGICATKFACCKIDGSCEELNGQDCAAIGGVFHDGLACDDLAGESITCAPLGACCFPPFSQPNCVMADQEACNALNGVWHSALRCDEVECPS